jgi:hypothetical protein
MYSKVFEVMLTYVDMTRLLKVLYKMLLQPYIASLLGALQQLFFLSPSANPVKNIERNLSRSL